MRKYLPSLYFLTLLLFLLSLAGALFLTWRDGFKAGPWLLTTGFLFLILIEKQFNKT